MYENINLRAKSCKFFAASAKSLQMKTSKSMIIVVKIERGTDRRYYCLFRWWGGSRLARAMETIPGERV